MKDGSMGDMMHAAVAWDGRVMMVQERLLEELLMSHRNATTTSTAHPPAPHDPKKGVGVESISEDPEQSGREQGEHSMRATSASAQTVGAEAMDVEEDGTRRAAHSNGPVARESASTSGDADTDNLCGVVQVVALMVNMALKVRSFGKSSVAGVVAKIDCFQHCSLSLNISLLLAPCCWLVIDTRTCVCQSYTGRAILLQKLS